MGVLIEENRSHPSPKHQNNHIQDILNIRKTDIIQMVDIFLSMLLRLIFGSFDRRLHEWKKLFPIYLLMETLRNVWIEL
jgi:hypothetical protein